MTIRKTSINIIFVTLILAFFIPAFATADLEAATIMTEEHRKIISLLKARNKEKLLTFMDSHIQGSNRRLTVLLKQSQFALLDAEKEINALDDILSTSK